LLVSFSDRTQSKHTNRLLLELTDTLAIELSHFLCLQLVVCNPYGDKDQSHLTKVDMKSTFKADYLLALYFQKVDGDENENKYRLIYRLVLIDTGEILWSENHVITEKPINEQDYVIAKITATVADDLQGLMHTHWSRNLLLNLETIPDYARVLVYFRDYTDNFSKDSFEKGVKACLEALSRNPNDLVANLIYAAFCRREYVYGRGLIESPLEKGKECIERAIRLRPNSHEIRYIYGGILFCNNDWEQSVEQFELSRSISKNNIVAEFGIGFHFCKMNQWEKGLELVNKAMLLSTNYPSYYHLVPCLDFYRQEKYEQALHQARKITIPSLVHGTLARCICYAQLGEYEKAEIEFKEILNRCPNFMRQGQMQIHRYLGTQIL
jgi:tetratricopeptide (TPR) repeat protein